MKSLLVPFALICTSAATLDAAAAGNCRQRSVVVNSKRAVAISSGLTVVPFAVPVAVPVATVSRPTLFYGYSGYVGQGTRVEGQGTRVEGQGTRVEGQGTRVEGQGSRVEGQGTSARDSAVPRPSTLDTRPFPGGAEEILRRNCATCHSGQAAHGGLQIFQEAGQMFDKLPRHVILEMVEPDAEGQQQMPPGDRTKLSPAEVQIIRDWARLPRNAVY